jgi:zinc transporter 1/2/3
MKLTQGVMAAVSAGMLIYAATVEMLAGDFIMDPSLWKSGAGRQALALTSLLIGAAAMAFIGYVLRFPSYSVLMGILGRLWG